MRSESKRDLITTTIRIDKDLRDDVEEALEKPKESLNSVVQELLKDWRSERNGEGGEKARNRGDKKKTLADHRKAIIRAISNQLDEETRWIEEASVELDLYREGVAAFGIRLEHYRADKTEIAKKFIPLLVERAERIANEEDDEGRKKEVVFVLDSGTSIFFAFEQLALELKKKALRNPDLLRRFSLISNNVPGVTVFMKVSHLGTGSGEDQPKIELPELVYCNVLPGRLRSRYGALLGPSTNKALIDMRADQPKAHFIGLVSGQFLRIDDDDPHSPIPLARTPDQISYKSTLIEVCDESFALSPLGKIFLNTTDEDINRGLSAHLAKDQALGDYCAVDLTGAESSSDQGKRRERRPVVKLVASHRPSKQLLFTHSERLKAVYPKKDMLSDITDSGARNRFINSDAKDLQSILIPFDDLAEKSEAAQMDAEFPHKDVRSPEFLKEFFSV
jgi:hypothetical protein